MDPTQQQQQPMAGGSATNPMMGSQPQGQKQDYVDKAFGVASKKAGHPVDQNTGEKITDAGRGVFEKITGKPISSKVSN